jgi:hypothetical protein
MLRFVYPGVVLRGIRGLSALVLSAAVACSNGHAGSLPTSSSPRPSTATPTITATSDLRASLRAALRAYFDTLYAAGLDPANKTDDLDALIAPTCTCHRTIDVLRDEARRGRYIDYKYSLSNVLVIEVGPLGGNIRYTVRQSAGAERDRTGRVIESYKATTEKYSVHFARRDGRWLLDKVTKFA